MDKIEYWKKSTHPQKSEEWYNQRKKTFGASEISNFCYANKENIGEYNYLFKTDLPVEPNKPMMDYPKTQETFFYERLVSPIVFSKEEDSPVVFGNRYEPIATRFFEKIKETTVHEVGSIQNKRIPFLAASPDGIIINSSPRPTIRVQAGDNSFLDLEDDIRGLEIKCPMSRVPKSYPGKSYYNQIQSQGYAMGARFVYFLDMDIRKIMPDDYYTCRKNNISFRYFGATFKNNEKDEIIYPPNNIDSYNELDIWITQTQLQNPNFVLTYHRIFKAYISKIKISKTWEKRNSAAFNNAYKMEQYYKSQIGKNELINKINGRKRESFIIKKNRIEKPLF